MKRAGTGMGAVMGLSTGRAARARWGAAAMVAGAAMTALAACGGSGHAAMPPMSMPATTPGGQAAPSAPVAGNAVQIKNFGFTPAVLTVRAGTTVTWNNGDEDPHTVSATGGPFHSKTLTDGATFRYTFAKPGRYAYLCTIHPFMRGTVVVTG